MAIRKTCNTHGNKLPSRTEKKLKLHNGVYIIAPLKTEGKKDGRREEEKANEGNKIHM